MIEKLKIRILISLIVMWYIIQLELLRLHIDPIVFAVMLIYSITISIIIESMIGLLRKWICYTPVFILLIVLLILISYFSLGIGVYLGLIVYAGISIVVDLYREFHMTNLLNRLLENHSNE
ncbi:MAG: hypothetical protein RR585_02665 [Coprobacillus sp.]